MLYLNRQNLDIRCKDANGQVKEDPPEVDGLIRLKLPATSDSRMISLHHTWRSDNILDVEAQSHIEPIDLSMPEILEVDVGTMIK